MVVALAVPLILSGMASGAWRAEPSAGDSKIAFIRDGDLFVMSADGSEPKRLAMDVGQSINWVRPGFAWSADGTKLAFARLYDDAKPPYRHSPGDIYVMSADGTHKRRITRREAVNTDVVAWSPDGHNVGYARSVETCNFCSEGPFEAVAVNTLSRRERRVAPKLYDSRTPAWAPSGRWIALLGARRGDPYALFTLFVMREDGTKLRRIADGDPFGLVSWSPNGQTIAYVNRGWIRSIHRTGRDERRLARVGEQGFEVVASAPSWSPDGRTMVFVRDSHIWVMNADGTQERRLTSGAASDEAPAWSPDGSHLAFTRYTTRGENNSIYLIGADGSGLRRLTRGPYDGGPRWQPRS